MDNNSLLKILAPKYSEAIMDMACTRNIQSLTSEELRACLSCIKYLMLNQPSNQQLPQLKLRFEIG